MSERLAVATVIAEHGGLDEAGSGVIAAGDEHEPPVTGMPSFEHRARGRRGGFRTCVPRDRVPHQLADLSVFHFSRGPTPARRRARTVVLARV